MPDASDDIERATRLARSMITIYGMSDEYANMAIESISDRYLDGRPVQNCSSETSARVDIEVREILRSSYNRAREILLENGELTRRVALKLLEKETLTGEEFNRLVGKLERERPVAVMKIAEV